MRRPALTKQIAEGLRSVAIYVDGQVTSYGDECEVYAGASEQERKRIDSAIAFLDKLAAWKLAQSEQRP